MMAALIFLGGRVISTLIERFSKAAAVRPSLACADNAAILSLADACDAAAHGMAASKACFIGQLRRPAVDDSIGH